MRNNKFIYTAALLIPMQFFNIVINQKVLPVSGIIPIEINFDLGKTSISRFKIRPLIETGTVENLNTDSFLKENIKVKINNPNSNKTRLWFLIQDLKTGKVYETNRVTLWSRVIYETYLRGINENIKGWGLMIK